MNNDKTIKKLTKRIINKLYQITCEKNSRGGGKSVYLYKRYVVGLYKRSELYYWSKKRYQDYAAQLVFPYAKVLAWNDCFESIKMERIYGEHFCDKEHDDIVIERLFEYAVKAPVRILNNGEYTYLQHRDVKRDNIIWVKDKEFVFIDLDNIAYTTILYDVLKYCNHIQMDLTEIVSVLQSHRLSIKKIFEKLSIVFDENYVDYILYHYAALYVELGNSFQDIAFMMNDEEIKRFPKTQAIINTLNNNYINCRTLF